MQPEQKIPSASFATVSSPPTPKPLVPLTSLTLLCQGAQAARGTARWQPTWSWQLGRRLHGQPSRSYQLCQKEQSWLWAQEKQDFPRVSISCEAACASIREARLTEETVGAALAGGCSPFPILPQTCIILLPPSPGLSFPPWKSQTPPCLAKEMP